MPNSTEKAFAKRRQTFQKTVRSYPHPTYAYSRLHNLAKTVPGMRQYHIRNDLARVSPGVVGMSNAMKASYIRVFKMFDKSVIRKSLIDIVPVIVYRMEDNRRHLFDTKTAEQMLPKDAPSTLNQVKKQMFERREDFDSSNKKIRFSDTESHAKLRRSIKQHIFKFHKKADYFNKLDRQNVLPDSKDSAAYHLFRAAAMYAAVYRVFHELSKLMPLFIPKSVLDFGTGTGIALLALKEIYDPSSMQRKSPEMSHLRQTYFYNISHKKFTYGALTQTLSQQEEHKEQNKKNRFMAVVGLIHRGEILLEDLPADLRQEIVNAGLKAVENVRRKQSEYRVSHADSVSLKWSDEKFDKFHDELGELKTIVGGGVESNHQEAPAGRTHINTESGETQEKTWWERLVEAKKLKDFEKVEGRLKPLQSVIAVEPSQGMIEMAMVNLAEELPKVFWRNSLGGSEPDAVSDLVVAAYTFSEIATKSARYDALLNLWKHTRQVMVIIDHGNVPGFSIMMEIRDAILEMKNVGIWDSQPTIIGPCPHEGKCPIQHCTAGNKHKNLRVCHTSVGYELTFVEKWIYKTAEKRGKEHFTYLIVAKNEFVPSRKARLQSKREHEEKGQSTDRQTRREEMATLTKQPVVKSADSISESLSPATSAKKEEMPDGMWNTLPVPQHVYNRSLSWGMLKNSDVIMSSNKALTIQNEVDDYEKFFLEKMHDYYRIVSEPHLKGYANFCKPNGDLVRARVKKYFWGSRGTPAFRRQYGNRINWQYVGGYRLLMRSTRGGLLPSGIPLFREKKFTQQDKPNTFVDDDELSPMEKTSMLLGNTSESSADNAGTSGRDIGQEIQRSAIEHFAKGQESKIQFTPKKGQRKDFHADNWRNVIRSTRRTLKEKMRLRHVSTESKNLKDPKKPSYVP
ncbi:methyltransferase-like protein 17 [Perkinsela sp. CCAP 1560/4]|nr:methyltransferase-like protein 17 [Perkinsela sp. CCAP 1560/4]|eukprot:KNH05261.1 methyltransferase-like protein 17 [Perkinsela sp. CCAP 1560/4]